MPHYIKLAMTIPVMMVRRRISFMENNNSSLSTLETRSTRSGYLRQLPARHKRSFYTERYVYFGKSVAYLIIKRFLLLFGIVTLMCYDFRVAHAQDSLVIVKAAEKWMALWDAGKHEESYKELAEDSRQRFTAMQWFLFWSEVRKPLGKLKSRMVVAVKFIKSLPVLPDQEGALLIYAGSFENKETTMEMYGMIREKDGTWRVGNYRAGNQID